MQTQIAVPPGHLWVVERIKSELGWPDHRARQAYSVMVAQPNVILGEIDREEMIAWARAADDLERGHAVRVAMYGHE
jgi:hypothetical protein